MASVTIDSRCWSCAKHYESELLDHFNTIEFVCFRRSCVQKPTAGQRGVWWSPSSRMRCEHWGQGVNFEDEVWFLRKATGFDTSKMTSHIPYHLRLLTVFFYSVLTCATRANLAQRRKKKITWHAVRDIWTEIGSPIIQCIRWLYPVNIFYATCPVLWRDRSSSQVLLGTLDVLWNGYFCVGGARTVSGMEWEAGRRSGVNVVTFGMCEIQDWNLSWKLFYLKVVKLWIRIFFSVQTDGRLDG